MAAAQLMLDGGVGFLRTLPPTDEREIARLRRIARALGIEWAEDTPYAERLRSIRGASPEEAAFLQQAVTVLPRQ